MTELTDKQCEVINALAFSGMNAAEAARTLGQHRNTILYHMQEIEQKTGLNPKDFFDLQELYAIAGGNDDATEKTTVST